MLFFTYCCVDCAHLTFYANSLTHLFPNLTVFAIDAIEFPSFNTKFNIVGLPTMLQFLRGKPIVKFNKVAGKFFTFVTRHTGIKPTYPTNWKKTGPWTTESVRGIDYVLWLAWIFVLLCNKAQLETNCCLKNIK